MRLLRQVQTHDATVSCDLSLTEFFPPNVPPRYAILSHRWSTDEVVLEDVKSGAAKTKIGYRKLEFCAQQAAKDGIDYFWVDTCCIDKPNNTELSEAINSMFRWYKNAAKCYVYLPDVSSVSTQQDIPGAVGWESAFRRSTWFTRGWTLQELVAPTVVEFFSMEGERLGDKQSLEQELCQITKIPVSALRGQPLSTFGIEERFGWAAGRETTREEDAAYCLLGIFNVYMPLIYGERRENAMARLRASLDSQHAEERKCHQSLKTSSYEAHKDRNPMRVPKTCQWVLSHSRFRDWRSGQAGALLWISADPGCGKSVLCRSLVDRDLGHLGQTSICYFFFKDNSEQDSLAPALCAVLHQLFAQQPQLLRHTTSAWNENGARLRHETRELWRILIACAADQDARPIICVFDALDECRDTERRQLIEKLCEIQRDTGGTSPPRLRILVTSRPYDNVQRWFASTTAQWPQIRLRGEDENERIHQEINLVIKQQVQDLVDEFDMSFADQQYLRQQLLQMQHRTYLWLHLAMEEVREACRESIFSSSLQIESLPSSVEDAYARILGKIGDKQRPIARKVLLIIVGARRPFSINEMAMALSALHASDRGARTLSAIDAQRLEKQIRDQCGLFVYVQHSQLFLIHQTAKEFLMTNSMELDHAHSGWRLSLYDRTVENQMARLCMTFLCEKSVFDGLYEQNHAQLYKFFQYCAANWTSHLHNDMLKGESKMMEQALQLYRVNQYHSGAWLPCAWENLSDRSYEYLHDIQVQHAIAIFGHGAVLEELCRLESLDLELPDSTGRTALHWAVRMGHYDLVGLLLERGADVNTAGDGEGTPLQVASWEGHEEIAQLLLNNGAQVNTECAFYDRRIRNYVTCSALLIALERGHERVAQMLLNRGADVNARGGSHGNALQAAIGRGNDSVLQQLLEGGADVNVWGRFLSRRNAWYIGSPLQMASDLGKETVVQKLFDYGADVNAQGGDYGSALHAALVTDNERLVQILLDKGADINAPGGCDGNALQTASFDGNLQRVLMLLDKGADANAQGGRYRSALHAASSAGNKRIIQTLLERDVDVSISERDYGNTLGVASYQGWKTIVQMLLDKEIDVKATKSHVDNALCAASSGGHLLVVQMLIDAGADVNAKDPFDGTALQEALDNGHTHVVKLLLERGAVPIEG